jgi:hypothetical protein
MNSHRWLSFAIVFIISACQSSGVNTPPTLTSIPTLPVIPKATSSPLPPTPSYTTTPPPTPIPPTPTFPSSLSSLRIAFTDEKKIWLWQNGTANLLTTVEGYSNVELSNDGEIVAFKRNGLLWVINADGTSEQLLVDVDDLKTIKSEASEIELLVHQFNWIPGTHILLFNTSFSGMGISNRDDLHQVDIDTLEWRTLRRAGEGGTFLISPDGKRVAMVTSYEIKLMKIGETNYRSLLKYSQIDTGSEYYYYARPIWSLDSQSLIVDIPPREFMNNPSVAPRIIWQLFVDGTPPIQIAQLPAQYNYFVSPDFSKIAYIRLRDDLPREIHISNIDGSEDIVYEPEGFLGIETWSPDSQYLVLISREKQYYAARIGDEPLSLTEPASEDFLWIDEQYFLYKTFHNGVCELRLGTIGEPSTLLATLVSDPVSSGCSHNPPSDFVK